MSAPALLGLPSLAATLLAPVLAVFLHPILIAAGVGAAAVPVIIHWLNRRRVRPLQWAAMQWLLAALKKQQRRLKMENWLILALRCLALFVLGSALARWIVSDSTLAQFTRQRRSVVLLLDTSYSTAARDGARAVTDRVREEADKILATLGSDDVAVVVVSNDVRPDRSGTRPSQLVPRVVGREGAARARATLGSVRATEAPAAWPDALLAAAPKATLQEQDTNRVLYWLTDLQAKDWRPPENRAAADPLRDAIELLRREAVEIKIVDVGGRGDVSLPNLGIASLALDEEVDLFAGSAFRLAVRVENFGPRDVERATLRVFLDDAAAPIKTTTVPLVRAANAATLAPGARDVHVVVPSDSAPKAPGAHAVRVEISPPESDPAADALGLDSRRVLALDVRSRLRIVAWIEPSSRAKYDPNEFLRAFFVGEGAGDHFEFDSVRNEDELRRTLADAAHPPRFVILGNREPRGAEAERDLLRFVREGGALAVFTGDDFDETVWNSAYFTNPATRMLPFRFGPRETTRDRLPGSAWRLDSRRASAHPLSKMLVEGDAKFVWNAPVDMFGRTKLILPETPAPTGPPGPPAANPADDLVVLRFREGDGAAAGPPAVVEGPVGLGRVLYFATALDDAWLGMAAWHYLLPVVLNESVLSMTRGSSLGRNLLVGGVIRASLPKDAYSARLGIPGRGEETLTIHGAESEGERPEVSYERVGTTGAWRLTYERPPERGAPGGAPRREEQAFGVNADPTEGSLAKATRDAVRHRVPGVDLDVTRGLEDGPSIATPTREGELTSWLLFVVLGVLLLEPYLAMRFGRHDARAAAATVGATSGTAASPSAATAASGSPASGTGSSGTTPGAAS